MCCLVFFLLYLLGMLIIMGVATGTGNPMRLIYGTDYMGATCGHGPDEISISKNLETQLNKDPSKVNGGKIYWDATSWSKYYKKRGPITYPRTNVDQLVQKMVGVDLEKSYPTLGLPNFYGLCVSKCPVARAKTGMGYEASRATIEAMHNTVRDFTCITEYACVLI